MIALSRFLLSISFLLTFAHPALAESQNFIQDDAHLFSRSAITTAKAHIAAEYAQAHRPIFVHTVGSIADGLSNDARADYRAHRVNGIELYVVKDARRDQVVAAANLHLASRLSAVHEAFDRSMTAGDPDRALIAAVDVAVAAIDRATGAAGSDDQKAAGSAPAHSSLAPRANESAQAPSAAPAAPSAGSVVSKAFKVFMTTIACTALIGGIVLAVILLLRKRKAASATSNATTVNGSATTTGTTTKTPESGYTSSARPYGATAPPVGPAYGAPGYNGGYGYGYGNTTIVHEDDGMGAFSGALIGSELGSRNRASEPVTIINNTSAPQAAVGSNDVDTSSGGWGDNASSSAASASASTDSSSGGWGSSSSSDYGSSSGGWGSSSSSSSDSSSSSSSWGSDSGSSSSDSGSSSSSDSGGGW